MTIEEKIRKLYPEEDFRIGDTLIMTTKDLSNYLSRDFYTIRNFVYSRKFEKDENIVILTNEVSSGMHPLHFKNLSALRRKKMKNII